MAYLTIPDELDERLTVFAEKAGVPVKSRAKVTP